MDNNTADARGPGPDAAPVHRATRSRQWKRSAGVVAAVALLVVGPARSAAATAPQQRSDAAPAQSPATQPSRFSTLSSGSYAWHVASSPAPSKPDDEHDGSGGPLHGEFPVVAVDGTVQTRRWQSGRVVTVSDGWFAVISDDGYRNEFALGAGLDLTEIQVGREVTVVGVVDPTRVDFGARTV